MEKIPERPLDWSLASEDQKTKILDQLADIFIELHKYPFPQMGALQPGPKDGANGQFATESLLNLEDDNLLGLGSFTSLEEYYTSSIHLILDLILREEMYTSRPIDGYFIHRFMLDAVPKVVPPSNDESPKFYLKHADDKGDQSLPTTISTSRELSTGNERTRLPSNSPSTHRRASSQWATFLTETTLLVRTSSRWCVCSRRRGGRT